MKNTQRAICVLISLVLSGATAPAFAGKQHSKDTKIDRPAPPAGFQFFCIKNACEPGGRAVITYTSGLKSDLEKVNGKINGSITYRPERRENWRVGKRAGDCEDYVLAKRDHLIQMGYPPSALRLATGWTRQGVKHAVLAVATTDGFKTLDNRRNEIVPLSKSGLSKIKVSTADPKIWVWYR
jgi:predicted transglutaminase-like cysteine proteinase